MFSFRCDEEKKTKHMNRIPTITVYNCTRAQFARQQKRRRKKTQLKRTEGLKERTEE